MTSRTAILKEHERYIERISEKLGTEILTGNSKMFAYGKVCGDVEEVELEGKMYYQFLLECDLVNARTSDIIPILIEANEKNASLRYAEDGTLLTVVGAFQSNDWNDDSGNRHLDVYLEAADFCFGVAVNERGFDSNIVLLSGYICTDPEIKRTPNNRTITELRIKVTHEDGTVIHVPLVYWGKKAIEVYEDYCIGDRITVLGRLQSRQYYKKFSNRENDGECRIAYEVSTRFTYRTFVKTPRRERRKNPFDKPEILQIRTPIQLCPITKQHACYLENRAIV